MSQILLIPRRPQHDNAIAALVQLRDCYPVNSNEWNMLNANCETINRLGGRKNDITIGASDVRQLVRDGYEACLHYASQGVIL